MRYAYKFNGIKIYICVSVNKCEDIFTLYETVYLHIVFCSYELLHFDTNTTYPFAKSHHNALAHWFLLFVFVIVFILLFWVYSISSPSFVSVCWQLNSRYSIRPDPVSRIYIPIFVFIVLSACGFYLITKYSNASICEYVVSITLSRF